MVSRLITFAGIAACMGSAVFGQGKTLSIVNAKVEAKFDTASGRFSLTSKPSQRVFLKDCRLGGTNGTAKIVTVTDKTFGRGEAIEVSYANGCRDTIMLFPELPFALVRAALSNQSAGPELVGPKVQTFSGAVDLGKPAKDIKTLGTGGLLAPDKNPGSYSWLAVVEPASRNGVILGWLTEDRGSGVVFSRLEEETVRAEAQIDYGHLRVGPGTTEQLETLAVGWFEDARLGLEAWADAVAKVHDIHLPPQPVGYCTWYSQPHGGASDEKHLAEQSAFAASHLAPFGFSVIQIDDQWQAGISTNGPKRDFTTHNPSGPYPGGMKAAADNIKSVGLVPGIWFMPFSGTYYDPFFRDHQDWFAKHNNGAPYETAWGGTCLDMTNPGAREHLRSTVRRIADDWGYLYFKMDGLSTGVGVRPQYVNSGYKDDGLGDAVFHDPDKSNLEAFRDGLRLVRETVGQNIFILGCCTPQNMRSYGGAFGLVDAMRIGPDNGTDWKSLTRGPTYGSRHYFLHGRVWYNDPDPVYVRGAVPLNHAQLICSWVTLSGQLNFSSEWLPGLSAERLDLLKRTMPSHGLRPRPVDLFERELPSVWLLTDTRRTPRRDVIGLFNWESKEQRFEVDLDRLGLDGKTEYVAFDYWSNAVVQPIKGRLQIAVPAESCRILAVRPQAADPQLLSTSRHITQGIVDVLEERWDAGSRTLHGRSRVVAGDPYELRIVAAAEASAVSAGDPGAGVKAVFRQSEGLVRVTIESPANREVSWAVKFKSVSSTATGAAAVGKSSAAELTLDVAGIDRERILKAATAALATEPITIAKFRAQLSEGGANDFYSNGDYWWPDPTKTNGLPYIQRDGESNPDNFTQHRRCIAQLRDAVAALGAAYKITGDGRYASKAVELLRVFFLDAKTRMNPHLKYAQAIPGRTPGRGIGIIDTLHLIEVPVAIAALQQSPAFPPDVLAGLKAWFRDYAEWMATSKNGQDEAAATNNHSVAFYLQLAAFAEFAGDDARVVECRRRFKEVFIPKQMAADGSFPAEFKRTKPYGYSIFQLDNMVTLCQLLSTENDSLWSFVLPDGRGIRKAVEFLYPYLADKSTWPRPPDIQAWNGWPARQPALLFAGLAFGEQKYLDLWQKLPADPDDPEVRRNIAITQPLLWLRPVPQAKGVTSRVERVELRTPSAPLIPRINGPSVFGVRPGSPFLYRIPATGERPMEFSVEGLPAGLRATADTGEISGALKEPGQYLVTLHARNARGTAEKRFRIVVGETIALTPPMGWNSWNCWGSKVDAEKVLKSARGMVASGLINHGWVYMNIDDAWQGKRGGPFQAIQGNEKFPDMKGLCDTIHQMGLKVGIYSTPWVTSYATHIGGSAENPEGTWSSPTIPKKGKVNKKILPWAIGKYHFATNDARQWAAWGMDYLKYDWNPNELPETREMYDALRSSGRDVVFSLSNNSPFTNAPALSKIANCWRTTGDIRDNWDSMSKKGFGEDKWEPYASPGHWNDPDMLVVGRVGWGSPHPTKLTPDEQYTHISLWCLLAAPLLLGCDLDQLDDFTLNLLTNDEVLAVNQDSLGKQALCVAREGDLRIYAKDLENGSKAVGLFNLGTNTASVTVKWSDLRLTGKQSVRDLWRQKGLGTFEREFQFSVAAHGAELVKLTPAN